MCSVHCNIERYYAIQNDIIVNGRSGQDCTKWSEYLPILPRVSLYEDSGRARGNPFEFLLAPPSSVLHAHTRSRVRFYHYHTHTYIYG